MTAAGPRIAPLLELSAPTFARYAAQHGYELIIDRSVDDRDGVADPRARARARWHKPRLIRRILASYELVVWLDADAVVCDDARDIADDLTDGYFQGLVLERFPDRVNPNTGVWVLRNEPCAQSFLGAVLATGQLDHSWADQAAVCVLLGWELGDRHGHGAGPAAPTRFRDGTAWLPAAWNVVGEAVERPRIRHFAGMPMQERIAAMRAAVRACPGR